MGEEIHRECDNVWHTMRKSHRCSGATCYHTELIEGAEMADVRAVTTDAGVSEY